MFIQEQDTELQQSAEAKDKLVGLFSLFWSQFHRQNNDTNKKNMAKESREML